MRRSPEKWQLLAISQPQTSASDLHRASLWSRQGRRKVERRWCGWCTLKQFTTNYVMLWLRNLPSSPSLALLSLDRLCRKHKEAGRMIAQAQIVLDFWTPVLTVFATGMQWLQWTAMPAGSQMSSSLRSGPGYTGSPQPMPSVLQVGSCDGTFPFNSPSSHARSESLHGI